MSTIAEDATAVRDQYAKVVPGVSVASFPTYGDAYTYMTQVMGGRGYTVTADTMLGYSVRKWVHLDSLSQHSPLRAV